jgi:hypothetical protein
VTPLVSQATISASESLSRLTSKLRDPVARALASTAAVSNASAVPCTFTRFPSPSVSAVSKPPTLRKSGIDRRST